MASVERESMLKDGASQIRAEIEQLKVDMREGEYSDRQCNAELQQELRMSLEKEAQMSDEVRRDTSLLYCSFVVCISIDMRAYM